jgi:hypothetical protein
MGFLFLSAWGRVAAAETFADPTGSLRIDLDAFGQPPCVVQAGGTAGDCELVDVDELRSQLAAATESTSKLTKSQGGASGMQGQTIAIMRFTSPAASTVVVLRLDLPRGGYIIPHTAIDAMWKEMEQGGMKPVGPPTIERRTVGGTDAFVANGQLVAGGVDVHSGSLGVASMEGMYQFVSMSPGKMDRAPAFDALERSITVTRPATPVIVDKDYSAEAGKWGFRASVVIIVVTLAISAHLKSRKQATLRRANARPRCKPAGTRPARRVARRRGRRVRPPRRDRPQQVPRRRVGARPPPESPRARSVLPTSPTDRGDRAGTAARGEAAGTRRMERDDHDARRKVMVAFAGPSAEPWALDARRRSFG